eukprot:CAMPEP_0172711680 /NCGR_PEP_ID=MMETSP1074-20121228/59907_1 /TAXON_ID=2916 /ORGANISM="Ceratium fusus, Strain PA161109" /LENGTH=35 /DNA_ID= /DNA_START= /DNA_END= /DNA_ORIENTATION=
MLPRRLACSRHAAVRMGIDELAAMLPPVAGTTRAE